MNRNEIWIYTITFSLPLLLEDTINFHSAEGATVLMHDNTAALAKFALHI